jgi:hypothetical protein
MDIAGAPEPPRIKPNERNAKLVHASWQALPLKPRLVLKAEYPERHDSRLQAAKSLKMQIYEYEYHLGRAVESVQAGVANALRA